MRYMICLLECFEPLKQFFSYLAPVTITGDWTAKGLLMKNQNYRIRPCQWDENKSLNSKDITSLQLLLDNVGNSLTITWN
jgi:hypothetical protein